MHALALVGFWSLLAPTVLDGKRYLWFSQVELGMTVEATAKRTGKLAGDALIAHQRPVLLDESEWQPRNDRVRRGLLSFYRGELSRIVLTYDGTRSRA